MTRLAALLTRLRRERCFCGWRGRGLAAHQGLMHTAVEVAQQTQALREVVADAQSPLLLGLRTLRRRLRATLEAPRG